MGAKKYRNNKKRDKEHRKASGLCPKFHAFIQKVYREGKTFDDVLEYFELESVFGYLEDVERAELSHTDLRNALSPNGFVLSAGNLRSRSKNVIRKQANKIRGRRKETHECQRRKSEKLKGDNNESPEARRKQSERMTGNKQSCKENWSEETRKRVERKEYERNIQRWIKKAKAKAKKLPKMSDTKLCEFIIIKAGRPMSEKGVVQVL